MCELLGMECNVPTDIVFSWARLFLEPAAAATSALARHVRDNAIKTLLAVAHVRRRTRGKVCLENTHPFQRELWGRTFVFAHNGTLRGAFGLPLGRFRPMGNTDSEHAFCAVLAMLERNFGDRYPSRPTELWRAVASFGAIVGRQGTFNFLLADGTHLFARCDTRLCHIIRRSPFGQATLADDELRVDFAALTRPTDRVAVVATTPLTRDEAWVQAESAAAPSPAGSFSRAASRDDTQAVQSLSLSLSPSPNPATRPASSLARHSQSVLWLHRLGRPGVQV